MEIRCKKTKRFLVDIDIEKYLDNLKKLGISQEIPLEIVIPCPRCHKKEKYSIYLNHYSFEGNIETTLKDYSSSVVD
jgi:hypothetical protein